MTGRQATCGAMVARRGFSMAEVLVAIMVLSVGLVAVASVFPPAVILQKRAVEETFRQQHVRSADALLQGRTLSNSALFYFTDWIELPGQPGAGPVTPPYASTTPPARSARNIINPNYQHAFDVYALAEVDTAVVVDWDTTVPAPKPRYRRITGAAGPDMRGSSNYGGLGGSNESAYRQAYSFLAQYPLADRSLPSQVPPRWVDLNTNGSIDYPQELFYDARDIFWVPLVRRGAETNLYLSSWSVYVFLLQPPTDLKQERVYGLGGTDPYFSNLPALSNYVCANPFDPAYVPKVFRVPLTSSTTSNTVEIGMDLRGYLSVGAMVLADNGKLFRVAEIAYTGTNTELTLNEQTLYTPLDSRQEIFAVWIAPSSRRNDPSPLGEIRLLSNNVVSIE